MPPGSARDARDLFAEVTRLCGLSGLIGPGAVRRALRDVGAHEDRATEDDYRRALPQLEARVAAYRGEADAAAAARAIKTLLGRVEPRGETK